jgi:hypothetical protein
MSASSLRFVIAIDLQSLVEIAREARQKSVLIGITFRSNRRKQRMKRMVRKSGHLSGGCRTTDTSKTNEQKTKKSVPEANPQPKFIEPMT